MTHAHWSAAAHLLNRSMPDGYRDERTEIVAAKKQTLDPGIKSIVVFRIGLEWLALSTTIFQEVTESGRLHKVPHRTQGVLNGLVTVRGELLLCVALDVLLGMSTARKGEAPQETGERLVVCNRDGNRLAFRVSEVQGVHRYSPRDLREAPATLSNANASYVAGVLHWDGKAIGILDDDLLFYTLSKGLV